MHNFEQGFLSEPFDDVRDTVRQTYAPWRALLLRVNGACVAAQHRIDIDRNDSRQMLGAAYFVRTLASSQAAILLLEHGLLAQARTMLRASLESLLPLGAIYRNPSVVPKLLQSHEADKRTIADRMMRWKSPELRGAIAGKISDDELKTLAASKAPSVNLFDLASAAEMEDWYLALYSLLSFSAHATITDLSNHLVTAADGDVEALKSEPEVDDQASSWGYAIQIQIKALQALAGIFPNVCAGVEAFRTELGALVEQTEG
ncbi:MAG: DUF5677 domain-containing protein [Halobacteriota archaeon]